MPAFALDFIALFTKRQAIDFNNIVQHAGKDLDYFTVFVPIEFRSFGKGLFNKTGQIDRAKQTGTVGWQRLLTAGVGCTNIFAEPVVVHLVDTVNQDKTGFCKVIGG